MVDWLPTLFEAAGGDVTQLSRDLDGVSHWNDLVNTGCDRTLIKANENPPRTEVLINLQSGIGQESAIIRFKITCIKTFRLKSYSLFRLSCVRILHVKFSVAHLISFDISKTEFRLVFFFDHYIDTFSTKVLVTQGLKSLGILTVLNNNWGHCF